MNGGRKINWSIVAVIAPIVMCIFGWAYSIESRLSSVSSTADLSNRVALLEELITPLIIEYRVTEKLKELGINMGATRELEDITPPLPSAPQLPDIDKIYEEVGDDIRKQMAL